MLFGHDISFWVAVAGATAFKFLTSRVQNWRQTIVTVGSAVLAAWLATDAVLDWLNLDRETYKAPTAALIALVGENVMRTIQTLNLEKIIATVKAFRS